jgi:hypothetical protein
MTNSKKNLNCEVFQQNGASPHTANKFKDWCYGNLFEFWRKKIKPQNWPDLNPIDYYFWNAVKSKLNIKFYENLEVIKKAIVEWNKEIPLDEIKKSLDAFSSRVKMLKIVVENIRINNL